MGTLIFTPNGFIKETSIDFWKVIYQERTNNFFVFAFIHSLKVKIGEIPYQKIEGLDIEHVQGLLVELISYKVKCDIEENRNFQLGHIVPLYNKLREIFEDRTYNGIQSYNASCINILEKVMGTSISIKSPVRNSPEGTDYLLNSSRIEAVFLLEKDLEIIEETRFFRIKATSPFGDEVDFSYVKPE